MQNFFPQTHLKKKTFPKTLYSVVCCENGKSPNQYRWQNSNVIVFYSELLHPFVLPSLFMYNFLSWRWNRLCFMYPIHSVFLLILITFILKPTIQEFLFCLLHILRGNYFQQTHSGMLLNNQRTEQCSFFSFRHVISDYGNLSWFGGCIDTLVHHKVQDNLVLFLGGRGKSTLWSRQYGNYLS
jgi:hypothetical protein